MGKFMIRRILYALVTLFILSLTIFTVVRLTGDPVTLLAEPGARAEDLDRVRTDWGLDRPWPMQYLAFAKNVFTGELGKSFNYQMPVSTLYFQRLPNSLELALAATLISFFIGIPAGIISAVRVNSGWDSLGKVVALLGLVMILTFSVWLHWLPTSGQGDWRHLTRISSCPERLEMSSPSNRIAPAVGVSCSRISFEVVVLPHPDSPISPRVSPG